MPSLFPLKCFFLSLELCVPFRRHENFRQRTFRNLRTESDRHSLTAALTTHRLSVIDNPGRLFLDCEDEMTVAAMFDVTFRWSLRSLSVLCVTSLHLILITQANVLYSHTTNKQQTSFCLMISHFSAQQQAFLQ